MDGDAEAGHHDVIVVGLGVMGAAAAAELASRGAGVLGLDRHPTPHALGSSHGETRMIREAYFEEPLYVPLVQRAWEGWRELEERAGVDLLRRTGGLMLGPGDGELVRGVKESAAAHGLAVSELTASDVEDRFPAFRVPRGHVAVLEERAGYLRAEPGVEALLRTAADAGAELRFGEPATAWAADGAGVEVTTPRGVRRAGGLVLAAGPWLPELLPDLRLPLQVERQVQAWYAPSAADAAAFRPGRFPVFLWEEPREEFWYGFPEAGSGVKVARHHGGARTSPGSVEREVGPEDTEGLRRLLRRRLPGAAGTRVRASVCLYTNTPDGHFLVDRHPACHRVVLLSPCSGHGFKFAPVLGEMAADLALDGASSLRPRAFALDRLL